MNNFKQRALPRRRFSSFVVLLLAASTGLASGAASAADSVGAFALVAEMEVPAGIEAASRSVRQALAEHPDGEAGVEALRAYVARHWQSLDATRVTAMSRYHVATMRGWQMPVQAQLAAGRTIGRDEQSGHLYLELRGPRLPASFDIVHRHLTFYGRFDPANGMLDRVTATIRLEVFE